MSLPKPKPQKKANVSNPKDSNGKAEKVVKAQHKGNISKNKHDTATKNVHSKFNTLGNGPRKTPKFKKD